MGDPHILLILLDSEIEQHLDGTVLSPASYRVSAANTATSIEDVLLADAPDMVIVDDAAEQCLRIEQLQRWMKHYPYLPFCLVTGRDSKVEPIQAIRNGYFDCWMLPEQTSEVPDNIQRALQRRVNWLENAGLRSQDSNPLAQAAEFTASIDTSPTFALQSASVLYELDEAVIVVDGENRIAFINRKARDTFGVHEQNVQGRAASEILTHTDLLEILSESRPQHPTRAEIRLDDSSVLNSQVTPLPNNGLVFSMQDISHLKELDRVKSEFVYTVSHDLRSPLTAILGYVELLDRVGPINDQQRQFIHRIQISVQNITTLINDLLDMGRIEAGFDTRKEIIQLSPIVHYAVDGLVGRLHEKSQSLTIEMPEDLPQILGDPIRLRQMLNNLIVNANKYTQPGGEIKITGRAEGGQVILQVSDNGPGIPPSDQPYIFDKFYRAGNVPPDTPGTGLGLAIVRLIVENHFGRAWVDSTVGQGTTFTIVLPTSETDPG